MVVETAFNFCDDDGGGGVDSKFMSYAIDSG